MNKFEERSKNDYNKKADNFDCSLEAKLTLPFKKKLLSLLSVSKDSKVLDVGCGNGSFLNMLAKQFSFDGYGIDISENMIKNAQLLNPSMRFETALSENIPFNDETFDLITVNLAYHHFANRDAFAKEAFRLLKPKGLIYIAEMYCLEIFRGFCNIFVPLLPTGCIKIFSPHEIIHTFETIEFEKYLFDQSGYIQIVVFQKAFVGTPFRA